MSLLESSSAWKSRKQRVCRCSSVQVFSVLLCFMGVIKTQELCGCALLFYSTLSVTMSSFFKRCSLKLKSYNLSSLLCFEKWLWWKSCSRRWCQACVVWCIWREYKLKRGQEEVCCVCPLWCPRTLGCSTGGEISEFYKHLWYSDVSGFLKLTFVTLAYSVSKGGSEKHNSTS